MSRYHNVGVGEEQNALAQAGVVHKHRLDRQGRPIGTHEFIRPQPLGGFMFQEFRSRQACCAMARMSVASSGLMGCGTAQALRRGSLLRCSVIMCSN